METSSPSDDDVDHRSNSIHVEPFHRQRRVDGTLSFHEQILSMEQIVRTNGIDGQTIDLDQSSTYSTNENGGIWKEILHQGIGQKPSIGASCRLHYYAYFEHRDEPFDTSFKRRRTFAFRLGKYEVLPGIDFAVSTMKRRERAKFIISSDLLFGSLGCPPHIPESAWCLFIIEIQSTNDPTILVQNEHLTMKTTNEKQTIDDFAKRIRLAQILRNSGNEEYANGQLDRALRNYNKARLLIHNRVTLVDEKAEEQYQQLLLKLHLNSAQCYLRLEHFERCLSACRDALIIDPMNLKALFRACVSLRSLNQFDQAEKYLSKALQIEPDNCDLQIEKTKLNSSKKKPLINAEEIDVSDEFRAKVQSFLQGTTTIEEKNFTETERYYLELMNKLHMSQTFVKCDKEKRIKSIAKRFHRHTNTNLNISKTSMDSENSDYGYRGNANSFDETNTDSQVAEWIETADRSTENSNNDDENNDTSKTAG